MHALSWHYNNVIITIYACRYTVVIQLLSVEFGSGALHRTRSARQMRAAAGVSGNPAQRCTFPGRILSTTVGAARVEDREAVRSSGRRLFHDLHSFASELLHLTAIKELRDVPHAHPVNVM